MRYRRERKYKESVSRASEGSVWAVPLLASGDTTVIEGWAVAVAARSVAPEPGCGRVWFHGFGPALPDVPALSQIGELKHEDSALASIVQSHSLLECGYVCLGLLPGYKRSQWPWGKF